MLLSLTTREKGFIVQKYRSLVPSLNIICNNQMQQTIDIDIICKNCCTFHTDTKEGWGQRARDKRVQLERNSKRVVGRGMWRKRREGINRCTHKCAHKQKRIHMQWYHFLWCRRSKSDNATTQAHYNGSFITHGNPTIPAYCTISNYFITRGKVLVKLNARALMVITTQ
jgi:hypothetical protein